MWIRPLTHRHRKVIWTIALVIVLLLVVGAFLWEETYVRWTGMSVPAAIRDAVSVGIYIVAILVILIVILKLHIGAVLISTGLIAAVLGVAMQSTITDFFQA